MADYYTKFSLVLNLPDEAAQKYALDLAAKAHASIDAPPDFPPALAEQMEDWHFETEAQSKPTPHAIWITSDNGGIDACCAFIQHLLQKYNPTGRVTFEWSFDCSKPRPDAYGGGAAIITAQEIKSINTSQWLEANAA